MNLDGTNCCQLGALSAISVSNYSQLLLLRRDNETIEKFCGLPSEELLLRYAVVHDFSGYRWLQFHLKKEVPRKDWISITREGQAYVKLFSAIAPDECKFNTAGVSSMELAAQIIQVASNFLDFIFISPQSICEVIGTTAELK